MHLKFWTLKSSSTKGKSQGLEETERPDSLYIPDSPVPKPPMSEFVPREQEVSGEVGMKMQDNSTANIGTTGSLLTVVELFQSQGCSSCPPANDNVISISDDADVLVLTYEVTYWVRLPIYHSLPLFLTPTNPISVHFCRIAKCNSAK